MRSKKILLMMMALALVVSSCKKEKEARTIIASIEEPTISKEPKTIGDHVVNDSFQWGSKVYSYRISRQADREVIVKDEDGQKYYDNTVALRVEGPDGVVFEKTFVKADFNNYIDTGYLKPSRSVLMGIAFNRVEKGGNAVFVATVGSPDAMSDEFMPVHVNIDKHGAMTMSKMQEISDDEMPESVNPAEE